MSVPSFRNSRSKVRRRRLHHTLKPVQVAKCAKCGATIQPHHACAACGNYNDRQVVETVEQVLDKVAPKKEEKPVEKKSSKKEKAEKKSK